MPEPSEAPTHFGHPPKSLSSALDALSSAPDALTSAPGALDSAKSAILITFTDRKLRENYEKSIDLLR